MSTTGGEDLAPSPKGLCGTQVTLDHVLKDLGSNADNLKSHKATHIGVGKGFVSTVIKVNFEWKEPGDLPSKVVVKVPFLENLAALMTANDKEGEQNEAFSEENLSSELPILHAGECKLYDYFRTHPIYDVPIPKTFVCHQVGGPPDYHPPYIVFEDASEGAAQVLLLISEGLNKGQLHSCAAAIAKLQAHCYYHKEDWKKMTREFPKKFLAGIPHMLNPAMDALCAANPEFKKFDRELFRSACTIEFLEDYINNASDKCDMPVTVVHGDMHSNNLFFKADADGKVTDQLSAIIDFQVGHWGNVASDLSKLIMSSTTPDVRRAETEGYLRHYYDTLNSLLPDQKPLFSFEALQKMYKINFFMNALGFAATIGGLIQSPLIQSVEPESARTAVIENAYGVIMASLEDLETIMKNGEHKF